MSYVLVHFPNIDTGSIQQFRRQYDPLAGLIAAHITLVFPLAERLAPSILAGHIEAVLKNWHPFPFRLCGLQKSWDDYLYLLVEAGRAEVVRLHDELYSDVLAADLRDDLPYIPHVTLGRFGDETGIYEDALPQARQLPAAPPALLDKLSLLQVSEDLTKLVLLQEFPLGWQEASQ